MPPSNGYLQALALGRDPRCFEFLSLSSLWGLKRFFPSWMDGVFSQFFCAFFPSVVLIVRPTMVRAH